MSDLEDSDTSSMGEEEILEDPNSEQHEKEIQLLQQKDPEFYQYLKDFDKDLLDFKDEGQDSDDEGGSEMEEDSQSEPSEKDEPKPVAKPITTAMVDAWIHEIKSKSQNLRAIRSLLRAFRSACHYGDDAGDSNQNSSKLSIISSAVFNKIMVFVLNEMDGILRTLLNAPGTGGKKEMVSELMLTKNWKQYGSFMRVYLGNAYHILNQMTDEQMISFTIKRVRASAVFLAAFPSLLRKYIKVILHTWGTGRGILTVVSFLFLRDLCVRLGSDCLDTCLRGVYKAYIMNCKLSKSINATKLQHIQFLGNCVIELCGVDPPAAYQLAFLFIRQLATVLRGALTEKGGKSVNDKKKGRKERENKPSKKQVEKAYQRVYDWQYILCLELWTGVICAYGSDTDFKPLAYPLAQIIQGVANLVPTVRYFPLRLRCVRMLNRIATATGTFVPVTSLLLDMLEMKELKGAPAGGIGTAVNLLSVKHVDKNTVKTRAFQEACIYSVVDELAEHLAQWSYSVAFFELSFIPVLRLRSFVKLLKAERFRKEIKELVHQVEVNIEFTNTKRIGIGFSPNDPAVESFLQVEKEKGESPLSIFVKNLRERSQLRRDSLVEKSVIIGAESASLGRKFKNEDDDDDDDEIDEEEAEAAFGSSWLPDKKKSKVEKEEKKSKKKKRSAEEREDEDREDDIVEDLVLSSDEEEEEKDESDDGDEEMDFLSDDELEGTQRKRTFKGKRDFNKGKSVGKNKKKSKFKGGNKRARV